ncbi:MAG: DUF6769 family protein [Bacteroidales bacterium]
MKQRNIAFTIILLANVMLLVHSLMPHHHHNGVVCFTESHSQCSCNSNNHSNDCGTHHSSNGDDSGCCVVKQDYLVPSDEIGKTTRCVVHEINTKISNWFIPLLTSSVELQVIYEIKFKFHFFDDFPLYSCFIDSGLSLRAPPSI